MLCTLMEETAMQQRQRLSKACTNAQQEAKVKAWPKGTKWHIKREKQEQNSATVRFVTPSAQPPHAPLDIQVEPGPSVDVFLTTRESQCWKIF